MLHGNRSSVMSGHIWLQGTNDELFTLKEESCQKDTEGGGHPKASL